MASNPLVSFASGVNLTSEFETLYTVPSGKARAGIDAATFNNYSESNVTISIRLVQNGGEGDIYDEIITDETIRARKNFLAPSIIGQTLVAGGVIRVKVSVDAAVNAQITGTEIDV